MSTLVIQPEMRSFSSSENPSLIPTPYNRSDGVWHVYSLTFKLSFYVFSFQIMSKVSNSRLEKQPNRSEMRSITSSEKPSLIPTPYNNRLRGRCLRRTDIVCSSCTHRARNALARAAVTEKIKLFILNLKLPDLNSTAYTNKIANANLEKQRYIHATFV